MQFVALMFIREPSVRENITRSVDQVNQMALKFYANLPDDQLRAHLARMEMPEANIDHFRTFVQSDEYTIEPNQNFHMKNFVDGLPPTLNKVAPILG